MLKNNFSDRLSDEFLISIEKLLDDNGNFYDNLELLYKKYLGFDSKTLSSLPISEIENLLIHNRINDFSKLAILGILFIEDWATGTVKDSSSFDKLIKGFAILKDIFLNDKETKVDYYLPYLLKASDILTEYEISTSLKKDLILVFFKNQNLTKVDDLIFEIMNEDSNFRTEAINIYKEILLLDENILSSNDLTKEEILDAINDVNALS